MKRLILLAILIFPVLTLAVWLYRGWSVPHGTPLAIGQATNTQVEMTNESSAPTNLNAPSPPH